MEPVFDPNGDVVAWLNNDVIHDLNGAAVVFLSDHNVLGYGCAHLGFLDRGLFRDHAGDVVAYVRGAHGGPLLPVPHVPPIPPVPHVPPVPPVAPVPPIPSVASLDWSSLDWHAFISGGAFQQSRRAVRPER